MSTNYAFGLASLDRMVDNRENVHGYRPTWAAGKRIKCS